MPELIDKKRTEAKVFLIARFFIDRPDREVELVKAVIHRCCEEIDKQPTIEADINRAAIMRLCNEIEEIVTAIANWSENWQTVDDCRTVCDKLKEIGKELTGDAGSKTD